MIKAALLERKQRFGAACSAAPKCFVEGGGGVLRKQLLSEAVA
jgi:hypothetical protein